MGLWLVVILPLLVKDIRLDIKTLLQETADNDLRSKGENSLGENRSYLSPTTQG